jgi:hypothetical protein
MLSVDALYGNVGICSENVTGHTNALYGQNAEFFYNVKENDEGTR